MPGRQPAAEKKAREQFMMDLFLQDVSLSIPKANKTFKQKFGSMMSNRRAYEIRDEARRAKGNGSEHPIGDPPHREVSGPPTPGQKVFLIEGDQVHIEAAREIVQALKDNGVPVAVDHGTDAYLVIKS